MIHYTEEYLPAALHGFLTASLCNIITYLTPCIANSSSWIAGEAVAKRRRMPSSKGFDFFVESSFVEVYNEQCHDLYSKGAAVASNLPVSSIHSRVLCVYTPDHMRTDYSCKL